MTQLLGLTQLLAIGGADIEKQLRAETQLHEHVGYVYAGSEMSLLTDMISNPKRPFYKLGLPLFLRPIPREDFRPAIQQGFRLLKAKLEVDALELIFTTAQDAPHTIQSICHVLWDQALQRGWTKIAPAEVEEAVRLLLGLHDPVYSGIWTRLVPNQRRVLHLLAGGQTTGLLRQAVLREHQISAANMRRALQALEQQQLLRREERLGERSYAFEDPLFRVWLQKFQR
jgi:hypothetical protein